jgi:hypothetical protein
MAMERTIRVVRADDQEPACLVHLTKSGNHMLDLDLIGTEGQNAFSGKRKYTTCDHFSQVRVPVKLVLTLNQSESRQHRIHQVKIFQGH